MLVLALAPLLARERPRRLQTSPPNDNSCGDGPNYVCEDGGTSSASSACECGTDEIDCGYRFSDRSGCNDPSPPPPSACAAECALLDEAQHSEGCCGSLQPVTTFYYVTSLFGATTPRTSTWRYCVPCDTPVGTLIAGNASAVCQGRGDVPAEATREEESLDETPCPPPAAPPPPPGEPPAPPGSTSGALLDLNAIFGVIGGSLALCLCCCCAFAVLLARRYPQARAQAQPPPQVYYAPTPQAAPVYPPVA